MVPLALPARDRGSDRQLMRSRAPETAWPAATHPRVEASGRCGPRSPSRSAVGSPHDRQPASRLLDAHLGVRDTRDMSTRLDAERRDEQVRVEIELGSSDPLDQLRGLRAADRQLDVWQRQTITRAREQGSSWTQIGDALGVTKQAAWALYNEDVRDALDAVRRRSELTDEQAQRLADEERDALHSR